MKIELKITEDDGTVRTYDVSTDGGATSVGTGIDYTNTINKIRADAGMAPLSEEELKERAAHIQE